MNMPLKVSKIDRATWELSKPLDSRVPARRSINNLLDPRSNAESMQIPCIPLTDQQIKDYRALMIEVDSLRASGRHQEARRVKLIASNILRTGAPALE